MPSMLDAQRSTIGSLAKLGDGVRANSDAKTQAGLSRGAGQSKKLVNAAWTQTFPAQGATLDLDFANDRGFVRGVGQGRSMDAVTFTRASNGTFVKPDGTLGQHSNQGALGNNLLTFPQDFDNVIWTKRSTTTTGRADIAPDGTNTATKLASSTLGTDVHQAYQINLPVISATGNYVWSAYLKASEYQWGIINAYDNTLGGVETFFNLSNGTIGNVGSGCTASIENVGNGWYRCIVTRNKTNTSNGGMSVEFSNSNGTLSISAPIGAGILIWGAQLELGSTATQYFPTNINQPRFDWASTAVLANKNLANNTENITNNAGTTIVLDATTSPDGLVTAEKIIPTSGAATTHFANGGYTIPAGGIYTISCYAKKEEYTGFRIILSNATARYIFYRFDVNTGTYTGASPSSTVPNLVGTPTVDDVGSGWYRCRVTIDNNSTGLAYNFYLGATSNSTIESRDYSGDGTSGLYVWGSQVELGDTLTSYQAVAQPTTNTPLLANPTSNGLLIEEARTNRILWCRDATQIGTNLVNYSEQFDNAFWAKTGILAFGSGSVANTTATTDPLGGNTADLVVENALNDFHTIASTSGFPVAAVGGVYVASIYVKRPTVNGRRYFQITFALSQFGSSQYATFDLQTGLVSGSASTVGTPVMTDVGNGWYRCSMAATATSTASSLVFFVLTNAATGRSPSYLGDGVSGVYMWGAQVQETYLSNYVATTTAPIIGWRNTNVTVAKNQTGIDGVANACSSLTATSANGTCIQTINLVSGSRTASVYLKRITGTGNIQVTLDGITFSTVELSTTEWRRIVLSGTVTIPTVGIRIVTSGDAVAMDFAQVEDNTFASSPIMTTSATVTRAVDVASMSGQNFINWYVQGKGTLTGTFFDSPQIATYFSISTGAVSSNIRVYKVTATSIRVDVQTAGNLSYAMATSSIPNQNSFNSCCFSFIDYNAFLSVSGQTPFTETVIRARIIPTNASIFRIGADATGSNTNTTYIKRVFYIPQRLADNSLQVISGFAV